MTVKYRATFVYPDYEAHYDYATKERRRQSHRRGHYTLSTVRTTKRAKTHDWNWAVKQLRKGKSVRRLGWEDSPNLRLEPGVWGSIHPEDCTATDWVLTDA